MSEFITAWLMFSVVPNVNSATAFFSFVSGIASIMLLFYVNVEEEEKIQPKIKVLTKYVSISFLVCLSITLLLPSSKDVDKIIGGYVAFSAASYLSDSEEANKLPANVLKVANQFLENIQEQEGDK